eukprot:COSAG01_NODE_65742_length_276_cov_0.884393_1_plen_39_part_10
MPCRLMSMLMSGFATRALLLPAGRPAPPGKPSCCGHGAV